MEDKLGSDIWENRTPEMMETSNIAGDYEISNRGYTDADKATVRAIMLNGQILQGLVTEDQHPDWVNLSLEEMYDKLTEKKKADEEKFKQDLEKNRNTDTVKGFNDFVREFNAGNISPDILAELEKLVKGQANNE